MSTANSSSNPPPHDRHDDGVPGITPAGGHVRRLTPDELLQLAALDAMGLLDEQERREFEAAFAAAKPAHQAMVRTAQDRAVQQQMAMLSDAQPPIGMRQRILSKIAGLIGAERQPVLAKITPSSSTTATNAELERRLSGVLPKVNKVNRWWRTGAIAGVAAALLLGVTSVQLRSEIDRIDRGIISNNTIGALAEQFGPAFETTLMGDNAKIVAMTTIDAAAKTAGTDGVIVFDQATGMGHLLCRGLPEGVRSLTLTATAPGGEQQVVVLTFAPSASRAVQQLAGLKLAAGSTLDLRVTGTDQILLRGTVG